MDGATDHRSNSVSQISTSNASPRVTAPNPLTTIFYSTLSYHTTMGVYQELRKMCTYRDGPLTYLNRYYRDRRELVEPWKLPNYLYHKIAKELWRKDYILDFYEGDGVPDKRALLLTHITPFYRDPIKYDPRPGRWSKTENARVLNEFGFSVDIYNILGSEHPPDRLDEYDLIIGSGRDFTEYAQKASDDCLIVLYATGMPQTYVSQAYRDRIDEIEQRTKTDFSPERPSLLTESSLETVADAVIVMGDEYTARLFEQSAPGTPVYSISTTHPQGYETDIESKDYDQARKNFLWFGGTGAVLKGLDRVLDVFDQRNDVNLYVCGPVRNNTSFFELYEDILYENENIHLMGWTDIRSSRFERLADTCGYMIYPSAAEGSSGAVAVCRWRGIVPIVTTEVMADTDGWGVSLSDDSIETIDETVSELAAIDPAKLASMTRTNYDAARQQYAQDRYTERLRTIFTELFDEFDTDYSAPATSSDERVQQ